MENNVEFSSENTKSSKLKKFFAYFLIYNGAIFSVATFGGMFAGKGDELNLAIGGIIMGIIPLYFGLRLLKSIKNSINQFENAHHEKIVLNLARQNQGTITATEITMNSEYSIEESRKMLDDMVIKGYATSEVTDEGAVKYVFPELLK